MYIYPYGALYWKTKAESQPTINIFVPSPVNANPVEKVSSVLTLNETLS